VSDLRQNLNSEFRNEDYRYAYAESFLNTKLATQIKVLREARGKTQAEMGCLIGTKQSGFSRFEDVNHTVWKTDTLWKIARALGVRVDISFETFGSLIEQKERFSRQSLERPDFANDPAFSAAALGHTRVLIQIPKIHRQPEADGALRQLTNVIQMPLQGGPKSRIIGTPSFSSALASASPSATCMGFEFSDFSLFPINYSERPERLGSVLTAAGV